MIIISNMAAKAHDLLVSYEPIAKEYYDQKAHPTCHNFNRLSRLFVEQHFPEPWGARPTIEVGAGASSVAPLLDARGYALSGLKITDASAGMLQYSEHWGEHGAVLSVCDAQAIEAADNTYDILVASLGDPYNTSTFWAEAARVVRPYGQVIFTTPSFEWSARFRNPSVAERQTAEFFLSDGQRLNVPSFTLPLDEQILLMQNAGFHVAAFKSLGSDALNSTEVMSSKLDVFGDEPSSFVWGFELVLRPL